MTTISKIGFTLAVQLAYPIIIVISGRQGSLTQELVAYRVVGEGVFNYLLCHPLAWSPAHLFTIRRRQKIGPGTHQIHDQNLPKRRAYLLEKILEYMDGDNENNSFTATSFEL